MNYFKNYSDSFNQALTNLKITDSNGDPIATESSFERLCELSEKTKQLKKKKIFVGNGASAAFANHMALDWSKNGGISSLSFADSALLSAVANDCGIEEMYSFPLSCHGNLGDMLIAISSSGNSPNIINAIKVARTKKMFVVSFSGLTPSNQIRYSGDLNFYVPAKTYGVVECAHQFLLHVWLDKFMSIKEWSRDDFQNMSSKDYKI